MTHEATDGEIQEAAGKAVAWMSKRLDVDSWRSLGVDRDDAMQEALLAAYRSLSTFDGSSPVVAWMYLKAKFGLQNYVAELREDRVRRSPAHVVQAGLDDEEIAWTFSEAYLDDEDCEYQPESREEVPGTEAERTEDHLAIRTLLDAALLGTLEDRERRVVRLRFGLDGVEMNQTEIAAEMGVSKQMIQKVLSRALNKLRAEFRADEIMSL